MKQNAIAAAVLMCAVTGVAAGCAASASPSPSSSSSSAASAAGRDPHAGGRGPMGGGQGSNARAAPAPGGAAGTVGSVSSVGFTITTSAGQKVTVDETSSTKYENGSTAASTGAVTDGALLLVLGTVDSTTITAAKVIVEPAGNKYTASSSQVVKFQQGKVGESKTVGTVPPGWNEGQGTIVTGTTADEAAEVALAAYPGAVVDRVVKLSSGDYNVHFIGVNWPHHVFLNSSLQVIGAE